MQDQLHIQTPQGKQMIYFSTHVDYADLLKQHDKVLIVVDEKLQSNKVVQSLVAALHKSHRSIEVCYIKINNLTKNTELVLEMLDRLRLLNLSRKSIIIAVGGGSTADLVGVVAATYMRGIDYSTIATSYTTMVDGIISKVAVNHRHTKNMVGAFYSPRWSVVSSDFLDSLDKQAIAYGLVEAWKHALIVYDDSKVTEIRNLLNSDYRQKDELIDIAKWSMNVKMKFVTADWQDTKDIHKALSLGHTLANYLEMEESLHHCEAVLFGIVFEALIAKDMQLLSEDHYQHLLTTAAVFENIFKKSPTIAALLSDERPIEHLRSDKISNFDQIRFVLPTNRGVVIKNVSTFQIQKAAETFSSLEFMIQKGTKVVSS